MTAAPVNTGTQPFRQDSGTARNGTSVPVPSVPPPYRAERSRNPGTIQPNWLAEKINNSRRDARPDTCPRCGADLLVGPDDDRCALTARVDPEPVDRLTEAAAVLAGRPSYELIGSALNYRDPFRLHSNRHPYDIHLEHRCTETETP